MTCVKVMLTHVGSADVYLYMCICRCVRVNRVAPKLKKDLHAENVKGILEMQRSRMAINTVWM